jgi:undecaprenyl-diphosphatase
MLGSAIFSILLVSFLIYKKYYADLKFYLFAFLGASVLFVVIKLLVERARPALKIINEQGFSFPSGHSTMSMVIALSLYFIFADSISSRAGRIVLLVVALLWPILIAFTRVYLNVHWLSDTLAGFSLGIFWVTLVLLFYPYWSHKGKIEFRS